MSKVQRLKIADLNLEPAEMVRSKFYKEESQDYADKMQMGEDFPPAHALQDGNGKLWVWDGRHTIVARELAGFEDVDCEVEAGTRKDAIRLAIGANAKHGIHRSRPDKFAAVKTALTEAGMGDLTDRSVAEACNVSHPFVGEVRQAIGANGQETRKDKRGRQQPATKKKGGTKKDTQGKEKYAWSDYKAAYGALTRQIDAMAKAFGVHESPQTEGLHRKLMEWGEEFKKMYKAVSKLEAPEV